MDGYVGPQTTETPLGSENYSKFMYIQELYETQKRIDSEIAKLSSEIQSLPQMPASMERWISSFTSNFKISDLSKIFKLNKKYKSLVEERYSNGHKIKLFAIDNVLEQIKETESQTSLPNESQ